MHTRSPLLVALILLLAACASSPAVTPAPQEAPPVAATLAPATPTPPALEWNTKPVTTLQLPDGYQAGLVAQGLVGPTQLSLGPDGWLWVATLGGVEDSGVGQLLAISPATGEQRIVLSDLFNPTGFAFLDGSVWLAVGPDIVRAPLMPDNTVGEPEIVLDDLPFNARTNGTLTVTPQGKLLYESSGRPVTGSEDYSDSGMLWELDPASPTTPRQLATGLKGPYAHAFDKAGRLWTTEIADDYMDGEAPPDELNLVVEGANFGWPQCFGEQEVAVDQDGTAELCAATRAPVALFPPHTTPTGIALSPWEEDSLLVALWLAGEIVRVPVAFDGDNATGTPESFIKGFGRPQHLLALEDGSLLVTDFAAGAVYRITRTAD